MTLQTFDANDITYTVSPEPESPLGFRTWAVIRGRLLDEINGQPPEGAIRLDSPFSGISSRVGSGGMVGFAGIPVRAFPQLKTVAYTVPVSIEPDGYIPLFRNVPVPLDANFPANFTPSDMGDLLLHRLPTIVEGRVVLNTGIASSAIAGAVISLTGLWRTPPPANLVVPPDPPDLVSLNPGIYFDRAAAGSQVQGLNFAGPPGPDKQLLQDAASSQSQLLLSDRKLIAPNDVLAIDTVDPAHTEYIAIQTIVGASTDDLPARITLVSALRCKHRQGATVHKVQFANVGAPIALTQDTIAGDVCLFVNGVGTLASAPLLSVQQGANPVEYHSASYFMATTDGQGFFRFPPLSRVGQCAFHCHDGAHPDQDVTFRPDYNDEVSRIDFVYH
jgi:hypothetical protein